jgi:protein arginine N-methyltransferase 1
MANTLEEHYGYLSDRVKLERYREAIKLVTNSEAVLLDLGCGTGLLGLLALQAGARKALFVEEGPVIEVARRTVTEAGFADRAEFFQANSYELSLPERVDVIVCDHIGYFGLDYGILALLADAKRRFLKADGIIVPSGLDLTIAPVESETCRKLVGQWRDGSVPAEFGWLADSAANTKHAVQLNQTDMLGESSLLATLLLGSEAAPYLTWNAEFRCERDSTLDGIAGWFDCLLSDGIRITNSPLASESLNRPQAFLPIEAPIRVREGELIRVTVIARHLDNVLSWVVELPDSGEHFAQSTFGGLLLDSEALMRADPNRDARLNERGRARKLVLSYCDGNRSVAEVEEIISRDHSELFPSEQSILMFVRRVLSQDTGK